MLNILLHIKTVIHHQRINYFTGVAVCIMKFDIENGDLSIAS